MVYCINYGCTWIWCPLAWRGGAFSVFTFICNDIISLRLA